MTWSSTINFMLLTHKFFSTFTPKAITEAATAGGKADIRPPTDAGFMYGRSFKDPDGHVLEPMWMDAT